VGPERSQSLLASLGCVPRVALSSMRGAGAGVFLEGECSIGDVLAIYPGLVYEPEDPALWGSWRNDYFLRRGDGSSVDGKFYGISGWMFSSTAVRNAIPTERGLLECCDRQWISASRRIRAITQSASPHLHLPDFHNPLNVGHFINCASEGTRANVMYHEHAFTLDLPLHHRKYLPNVSCQSHTQEDSNLFVKSILMIALKPIQPGEELLADYSFIGESVGENK
jgi:hypothetical protein